MKELKKIPVKPVSLAAQPKAGHALSQRNSLQPKMAALTHGQRMPAVAPPAYRPQPVPKVLQTKMPATAHQLVNQSKPAPVVPYRPQPTPKVLQTKMTSAGRTSVQPAIIHRPAWPIPSRPQAAPTILQAASLPDRRTPVAKLSLNSGTRDAGHIIQQTPRQAFKSGVVQALKYYPNLHPGAATPVDRSNIFTLDSFADQYRLHRLNSHGVNVPNMKYNFVRTREGGTLLHNRYRHPSLAEGQQVLYAGEVFFNNGKLEWWSNGSGHYQPDADGAEQANLPMDYFYSYQQVLKGDHTRKRA